MVSVLEGRLARTWNHKINDRTHIITLFHDTISGIRSAMLDFCEIQDSFGNSSLLMGSNAHKIHFQLHDPQNNRLIDGYIEIEIIGWTYFGYKCIIDGIEIKESTQILTDESENIFDSKIEETTVIKDEFVDGGNIVWYIVDTRRKSDEESTKVHRRFRDFVDMFSLVKQNFKGHHLRSSLPEFPEKTLKLTTNHMDPGFIDFRRKELHLFLNELLDIPHVSQMICVKAFLGLMQQVREFSISFRLPKLGLSLTKPHNKLANTPAIVGLIENHDVCFELVVGDAITKINGISVAGTNFAGTYTFFYSFAIHAFILYIFSFELNFSLFI